ncbi:hypothetical protein [Novosphingobium sp. CECT 9465]|uniref:hypothetical protein n=1 Tax=Novosphingobium sp. CECT 9465 TaxID=2829794 RepID=UPI001E4BE56A|nr:hypothetical protein [Novosphingobium sp. CECT 9465]CAH0496740.1 hypothetical protein NVSP9465_01785 [Novosphingobium sp. CECT 9465]
MTRRALWFGGVAALAAISGTLVAQESLLPPGFDNAPAPARPAPQRSSAPARATTPAPRPSASATAATPAGTITPTSTPVVQPVPSAGSVPNGRVSGGGDQALLNSIDPALLEKLIESAKPKFDIPPSGQRSLDIVGVIDQREGGFPAASTHYLNGPFVKGVIAGTRGRFVSRWGHILARRALASRLATPVGMNGADWAAIRAQLLLRMGEADAARALVQSVDSGNFTRDLEDAAMASFLATSDPVGLCPITALTASGRPGWEWDLTRAICSAFADEGSSGMAQLDRALRRGTANKTDILLAQKFAGAALNARRAVKIEWDGIENLTPWSIGMSFATGLEPPEALRRNAGAAYALTAVRAPMLPLASRAAAADVAAARGILSAQAMIDLYSQLYALRDANAASGDTDEWTKRSETLRSAYVAKAASDRMEAIRSLWGDGSDPDRAYSGLVLTSHAAARLVPSEALSDSAASLVASMLTAGLDRNALKWAPFLPVGSEGWGLAVIANPGRATQVGNEGLNTFADEDDSEGALRSQFLLAGLMGLERVDAGAARGFAEKLSVDLTRQTRWTRAIDAAAASNNPALVSLLAAFGMQGERWDRMTPLHLYHIVSALHRVGLDGEARMIAAEAVSRV